MGNFKLNWVNDLYMSHRVGKEMGGKENFVTSRRRFHA